ncbi:MAG: LuxR C-terminal-related transcriptional regulator [Campylobacterota bacterium]|nr:LuxR C-terminal-related transcriptional regulator [Campylobacterota bacterium]
MQIIFFSSITDTIEEFQAKHNIQNMRYCFDRDSLDKEIKRVDSYILIVDYDSVATELNRLIASNELPKNVIVLERTPEIITGKMLISHNIKAYGNIKLLNQHYQQIIKAVCSSKVWTYPELTASLIQDSKKPSISQEAQILIEKRLSLKEKEVVYLILDGLTNSAIASKLEVTVRTIKAHISSIFQKLHVNDRISLVLLLR